MDATSAVYISSALSLVISAGSTYAVIRFSPERKDLKRVRELLDRNAEQQQLSTQFECDVSIEDRKDEGARVVFLSEKAFQLREVQLATEVGAPMSTTVTNTAIGTRHEIDISRADISKLFYSEKSGSQRTGLLTYVVAIDGHTFERRRGVTVMEAYYSSGAGQINYHRLG